MRYFMKLVVVAVAAVAVAMPAFVPVATAGTVAAKSVSAGHALKMMVKKPVKKKLAHKKAPVVKHATHG